MQAITTKYIGPSNTKGSRVQAKCEAKTIYLGWDAALNSEANHTAAAQELAKRLGWKGEWISGGIETGYVFVCTDRGDGFTL